MTRLSLPRRRLALLGIALVVLACCSLLSGCSPARKESNDYAPSGTWPGLSPSTPREKPARKREPRRYGRRAIALQELFYAPHP